ncbi:MAG: membrane lipoprotein lipid attachment site-containing protein [Paludibacteraceae bacterium]|nr:membrane lipoprotein lipid attachment site-containing protein [Paludibacteraceae bacterium]
MKRIIFIISAVLLLAACKETAKEPASSDGTDSPVVVELPKADGTLDEIGVETVATGNVESLNNINFKVKVSNKAVPKECGIAYSTNLTDLKRKIAWRKKAEVTKSGEVSIKLDLLYSGTTYYYAAYSIYEGSCYHGEVKSLTTPKAAVGNSVYMGLSVDWSDRNLGADSPTGAGNFYCWADVIPIGRTSDMYTKNSPLNISDISGTDYDAVKAAWGGRWRLPTRAEAKELIDNCKWELVSLEGKQLFKVTPKSEYLSDNYIYIPLCALEFVGSDNAHDEYYPIIKKDAESVYLLTGTQVEKADWNPYVMNGDEMKWCYALDYYIIDYENEKKPSLAVFNTKYYSYSIRPVYEPIVIN